MAAEWALTIATDESVYPVTVASTASVARLSELVALHTGVAVAQQTLVFNGQPLASPQQRLDAAGVRDGDLVQLVVLRAPPPRAAYAQPLAATRLLPDGSAADPVAFQNALRNDRAFLASADPQAQRLLLGDVTQMQNFLRAQHAHSQSQRAADARTEALYARIAADPFDVEAQRELEELIRANNVAANHEAAMEHTPEVFASVHMLYINAKANGTPVRAFVDSGAQMTIMSSAFAKRCGIFRLLDTRYAGTARGVGTQTILGRVHSSPIEVGGRFFDCSFSVLEKADDPELIFGLDMLKRHQCCIDLKEGCLVFGTGERVLFLSEAEIPKSFGAAGEEADGEDAAMQKALTESAAQGGAGAPAPAPAPVPAPAQPATDPKVATLMALGMGREQAQQALASCGGDVDLAASMLFGA